MERGLVSNVDWGGNETTRYSTYSALRGTTFLLFRHWFLLLRFPQGECGSISLLNKKESLCCKGKLSSLHGPPVQKKIPKRKKKKRNLSFNIFSLRVQRLPQRKNEYVDCDYFFFFIVRMCPRPKIHQGEKLLNAMMMSGPKPRWKL